MILLTWEVDRGVMLYPERGKQYEAGTTAISTWFRGFSF
jgi:hypothetical protein